MRDEKWRGYLPYCNSFYFVCPPNIIQPEELPAEVGLLWATTGAKRLITKRKAVYRDIEFPVDLIRYILICRTRIAKERTGTTDAEYWHDWLRQREEGQELGLGVSKRIRKIVSAVTAENAALKRQHQAYEGVKRALVSLGLDPENPPGEWVAIRTIERAITGIPEGMDRRLDSLASEARKVAEMLRELAKGATTKGAA
jgi:hypothetical protein